MAIHNLPEAQKKPRTPRVDVIHETFQQRATRTPEAVALVFEQQRQTYAELELASDVIAVALKRAGVNPGDIVGVALPRSLELVGCLLGVLKAGAAYLPLDIQYPREHLAQVLADAAPSAVLSTAEDAQALGKLPPSIALLDITCLPDSAVEPELPQPTGNNVQPGDNAYVIYTSGSTGRPKGVLVTHHNVLRLLTVTQPALGFGNEDTWVLFHSYAFDFSVWENIRGAGSLSSDLPQKNNAASISSGGG
ncbi:AMP-binding protein [Pseudomonas sp. MPFS]|uniref:AMP-binding protein n=1 Tax=Pseudomonas sp. MPFS TaxID=2795724 RepID=UPI001F13D063|nr:AMP-binding protein [Pseudomonas sp. MPFS]UMZ09359.1 AMP-binding protein [Pseudomonas sp. MPFS]